MSALECPCQSEKKKRKGRGVLSDPSCWLSLDVLERGGASSRSNKETKGHVGREKKNAFGR